MIKGENRALNSIYKSVNEQYSMASKKPCIFLSHRSLDKIMVEKIGKYIMDAGFDIYLDKYDEELQKADELGNDKKVTECIQKGLEGCTHVLCLISPTTVGSWWVPYEIGYGEKSKKEIVSLQLKSIPDKNIPAYIRIRTCLGGINALNDYLQKSISKHTGSIAKSFSAWNKDEYYQSSEASIIQESSIWHPLKDYLNQ